MSTVEITSKIEALKDLESLIEEAKSEAEALRDEIKAEMLSRNTEEMEGGQFIVRLTSVLLVKLPMLFPQTNLCREGINLLTSIVPSIKLC